LLFNCFSIAFQLLFNCFSLPFIAFHCLSLPFIAFHCFSLMCRYPGKPPRELVLQAEASEMDRIELGAHETHPYLSVMFEDFDADVVFSESWKLLAKSSNKRRQSMVGGGSMRSTTTMRTTLKSKMTFDRKRSSMGGVNRGNRSNRSHRGTRGTGLRGGSEEQGNDSELRDHSRVKSTRDISIAVGEEMEDVNQVIEEILARRDMGVPLSSNDAKLLWGNRLVLRLEHSYALPALVDAVSKHLKGAFREL
jgi:hypothetical protein